ncbi:hypothetical protein TetV_537 [Tetraselmis virus 1]|uniref:Uncharacterized protein n=1 Tax=Tetraselmis virus 1 TaxID=2060617 RepID=A0A2P0VPA8_9VIRU|nr:hypothetical protein QJ968_gp517 [Tetraselmis virus 1]AUF82619.1 hypothetical protein TetV_537 [Tetraselmis virus 1]
MFPIFPEQLERHVWIAYFKKYVIKELLDTFQIRWIECRVGDSDWSERKHANTVFFPRSLTISVIEGLQMAFPCLEGEAEFAAIIYGNTKSRQREGYSRTWLTCNAKKPYWYHWEDIFHALPCRTLLRQKTLVKMRCNKKRKYQLS